MAEGALRAIPNEYARRYSQPTQDKTSVQYRYMGDGVFTLTPGSNVRRQQSCYDTASIGINEQGFRDRHREPGEGGFRILLMGDSFVEALQVGDDQNVAVRLEELLGADTMNGAISGFSTATELAVYRKLLRPFHPDLAILFFFVGNDVKGNSCDLDPTRLLCGHLDRGKPATPARTASGTVEPRAEETRVIPPAEPGSYPRLKDFLRNRFVLYQVLHDVKYIVLGLVNGITGHVPPRWQVYLRDMPQAWQDAWTITENYLAALRDDIAADGARLLLVIIPDHFATNPDWRSELMFGAGSAIPGSRSRTGRFRRSAMAAYRAVHNVEYPRFSYRCDGHWNPLTHNLVAHEVALFLARQGLLPADGPTVPELANERDAAFATSPRDFLGEEGYKQIYEGGVYRSPVAARTNP